MIKNLKIRNYALIEQLEIDFIPGFITVTGETGAGKSILMGALALILGQRADTSVLFNKDEKCIVEGMFGLNGTFKHFFEKHDLDFDTSTILRREILPGGKSRAFINDTPVNLGILKSLGDNLVDIHSQHQNLQLNDHLYQLQVVDHISENADLLRTYQASYSDFREKEKNIAELREEIEKIREELDFYQFQYDELSKADLKEDELQELEVSSRQLENAEEIKSALLQSARAIAEEGQILSMLSESLSLQKKIIPVNQESADFVARLESAYIELKDLAQEMFQRSEKLEYDPGQLQKTQDRLDLIFSLLQKHKLREISELLRLKEQYGQKIADITFSDERIGKLEKEAEALYKTLLLKADELHERRLSAGKYIEKEIISQLQQLGIPNASFNVRVERKADPDRYGSSDVRFLFSANRQSQAVEISRVASGGEISRVMLCIKSLLSEYKGLPTLIFDEIDAGVSGEIAEKMGAIMEKLSKGRQVLAITHLPQVASQGKEHFLVYKSEEAQATVTHIRKLNAEERITEIAKLLSGEEITGAAISNARELLRLGN